MKTLYAVLFIASSTAHAGGFAGLAGAGQVYQGMEQQRREAAQPGQQQPSQRLANVSCTPPIAVAYGVYESQCTRIYTDGRLEHVSCQRDDSGSTVCSPRR